MLTCSTGYDKKLILVQCTLTHKKKTYYYLKLTVLQEIKIDYEFSMMYQGT